MGINLTSILDPLDLGGTQAAESTLATAQTNAELLREFSDITQANLQPFLDVSNRQLPGLEAAATPEGFFGQAEELRPIVQELGAPIVEDRLRDLSASLGQTGSTRSGFAGTAAAQIQEDVDLSLLLQLQSTLQGRREQVTGLGTDTGTNLARLGESSAEQIAGVQSQGILGAAGATAAGQQNIVNLLGLGADFLNRPSTPPPTPQVGQISTGQQFAGVA